MFSPLKQSLVYLVRNYVLGASLNLIGNKQFEFDIIERSMKKNSARVIHANVDTYIRFTFIKGYVLS